MKLLNLKVLSRDRYKIFWIKYGHITMQKQYVISYLFILKNQDRLFLFFYYFFISSLYLSS